MTAARVWLLVGLAILMLLASVVWASLQLVWHMGGHTNVLPQEIGTPVASDAPAVPTDIEAITALAPFGQPVSDAPQAPTGDRSTLNITLRGVLVDPDPTRSRAFVQAGGSVDVYRVGETIQSAELVEVGTDTITLQSGDDLVIVGFEGIENGTGTADQIADADADTTNDPFARLAASIVPGQGSIDLRDGPPPETTDDYINLWRDRIGRNPQAAMDTVGVELVENGYRIKPDPNIGVTLAGLRPGDVITSLNGQSIGDLDKDRQLYDDVAAAGIARLEVVREGQSLLLTFPLR